MKTGCPVRSPRSSSPTSSRTLYGRFRPLGSGSALPRFPRSKARPDEDHVAVTLAVGRAPSSAVHDEAGAIFQLSPSPVAPCPPKVSPRQQPYRVTAATAFPPAGCLNSPFVFPRAVELVLPADHKALLHCRIRCRSRCCHRGRPGPSLGLRTDKTFRRFRVCEASFWCSPDAMTGLASHPRRSAVGLTDLHSGFSLEPPKRPELNLRGTDA